MIFAPGELPVVIRSADLRFDRIPVPGTVCACVRGVELALFGAGNAASGVIGCGAQGLADVDYVLLRDHDTTPDSAGNGGGLADDPQCDDCVRWSRGEVESCACHEGQGAACAELDPDACNSPSTISFSGGPAAPGAAVLLTNIAIGLLRDTGACQSPGPRNRDGSCAYPDYGADCLPCTDDDADLGRPAVVPATTGIADAGIFDANDLAGSRIVRGGDCYGAPCQTSATGAAFDCAQLAAQPAGGLAGAALAVCFPSFDAVLIGDSVTCTVLAAQ